MLARIPTPLLALLAGSSYLLHLTSHFLTILAAGNTILMGKVHFKVKNIPLWLLAPLYLFLVKVYFSNCISNRNSAFICVYIPHFIWRHSNQEYVHVHCTMASLDVKIHVLFSNHVSHNMNYSLCINSNCYSLLLVCREYWWVIWKRGNAVDSIFSFHNAPENESKDTWRGGGGSKVDRMCLWW